MIPGSFTFPFDTAAVLTYNHSGKELLHVIVVPKYTINHKMR